MSEDDVFYFADLRNRRTNVEMLHDIVQATAAHPNISKARIMGISGTSWDYFRPLLDRAVADGLIDETPRPLKHGGAETRGKGRVTILSATPKGIKWMHNVRKLVRAYE